MPRFSVVVGNIGTVHSGDDQDKAFAVYRAYVIQSQAGSGRAGREPVTLMDGEEIIAEHEQEQDNVQD